mmetsp:Transcript_5979/g.8717  ORF Transcript_5979/g.8717 Transcript_5979/m.8717 type:complete len:349 (-) Transcript_5979:83-1129(-)
MGCQQSTLVEINREFDEPLGTPLMSREERDKIRTILENHLETKTRQITTSNGAFNITKDGDYRRNLQKVPSSSTLETSSSSSSSSNYRQPQTPHSKLNNLADQKEEGSAKEERRENFQKKSESRINAAQPQKSLKDQEELELRKEKIRQGINLIQGRLEKLTLRQIFMQDDGNCQFRSIAHQLYGDADKYHKIVRLATVDYIVRNKKNFVCYFDGEQAFLKYTNSMKTDGTWGDELTLRAASNRFDCTIHVVTSEQQYYYMRYIPNEEDFQTENGGKRRTKTISNHKENIQEHRIAKTDRAGNASFKQPCTEIFLAYLSPLHYNSIQLITDVDGSEIEEEEEEEEAEA